MRGAIGRVVACLALGTGCSHAMGAAPSAPPIAQAAEEDDGPAGRQAAAKAPEPQAGSTPAGEAIGRAPLPEGEQVRIEGRRYIDPKLGFEISRPEGNWLFAPGQPVVEGITVPVIVAHPDSGAQVVVQVAPALATPSQLALRLTSGLRSRPGFATGSPAPLEGTTDGVGFRFTLGDSVSGRVAILPGNGHVFVLLATWPRTCPAAVIAGIDGIVRSMRTAAPAAQFVPVRVTVSLGA